MKEIPKIAIDFNEMIDTDLLLLSKTDIVKDVSGNSIILKEGMKICGYMEDLGESGKQDNLVAYGTVEHNDSYVFKVCKWNLRIDENGIRHDESNL